MDTENYSKDSDTSESEVDENKAEQPAQEVIENEAITPITPELAPAKPPKKKLTIKLLIVAVVVAVLVGAIVLYITQKDTEPEQESSEKQQVVSIEGKDIQTIDGQSFADKFIPNYSDMRGYAEHDGEHWYATFSSIIITKDNSYRIRSSREFNGITSFTGITSFNNEIWVSGQGGAAKLVGSSEFKEYLKGEHNVMLYVDTTDNKLYATTFAGVFSYDSALDSFVFLEGQQGTDSKNIQLGFNEKYIITAEIGGFQSADSVRLYNKATKTWENSSSIEFGVTGPSGIVTVDNKVLVFGRMKGYESCEQAGKIPASVFYQIEPTGSNIELPDLQEVFKNNEAANYTNTATTLRGLGYCEEDPNNEFLVDLSVEGDKIVAKNKRSSSTVGYLTSTLYPDKISQLEKELGFAQKVYLSQSVDVSDFSNWYKTDGTFSLYSSENVSQKVRSELADVTPATTIVTCDNSQFAIAGSGRQSGYGPPYLLSIHKKIGNQYEKIYETKNDPLYEGVSAELTLVQPEAICLDGKIVMLSETELATFDPVAKTITKKPHGFQASVGMSQINKSRDAFVFIDTTNKKLVTSGTTTSSVSIPSSVLFSPSDVSIGSMILVNDEVVVFAQQNNKETSRLATISAKDGSKVEVTDVEGRSIAGGIAYGESSHVLQYNNGETKVIDNKTHKSSAVISKKPSLDDNDSFPIVKSAESVFMIRDGHVWFTAENWGVVAYKLP